MCLQEVWVDRHRNQLARALKDKLPHEIQSQGGLMVLSRLPILWSKFTPFPTHEALSFVEKMAGKGLLEVVVETESGPVRVVASHLSLDRSRGAKGHAAQLDFLIERLRHDTETPTVICADLNMAAARGGVITDRYQQLLDAGFRAAKHPERTPEGRYLRRPTTREGWPRTGRRGWDPDYVLYRAGKNLDVSVGRFEIALDTAKDALSDHNLLVADFLLAPKKPAQ